MLTPPALLAAQPYAQGTSRVRDSLYWLFADPKHPQVSMQAPATSRRGGVKATGTELAAALKESRGTKKIWDSLTPSQFVQRLRTALKGKTFTTAELEEVDRDLLDDAVHALTGVGRDDDDPVSKLADDFMASWNQTESFTSPLPKTVPFATPNRPRRSPSPRRGAYRQGGQRSVISLASRERTRTLTGPFLVTRTRPLLDPT